MAYEQMGLAPQSIIELQEAVKLSGGNLSILGELGHAYGVAGQAEEARQVLEQILPQAETVPYQVALIYLSMRNQQKTFEWLNKAILTHNDDVTQIKVDPRIDPLRSNPRLQQLVERLGFPLS
jgi:tetratricopeptide (TPR) repeat protein